MRHGLAGFRVLCKVEGAVGAGEWGRGWTPSKEFGLWVLGGHDGRETTWHHNVK